uniref:Uncharacterized protein n=1 Tax=Rhizophora mucronata TaxID=61149 RepID=A0A2P2P9S2_RHIMU
MTERSCVYTMLPSYLIMNFFRYGSPMAFHVKRCVKF